MKSLSKSELREIRGGRRGRGRRDRRVEEKPIVEIRFELKSDGTEEFEVRLDNSGRG